MITSLCLRPRRRSGGCGVPEELLLPTVLLELSRRVRSPDSTDQELYQVVHAMQRMGIPQGDIEVHLERIRAANDATSQDERTEENCIRALEMVIGEGGALSLAWDHAEMASVFVPRVVGEAEVRSSMAFALEPSDMLPARPTGGALPDAASRLPGTLAAQLSSADWRPEPADQFRVPKGPFTTRPAALLAARDRLVYEALVSHVEIALDEFLPEEVFWPRLRGESQSIEEFREAPEHWGSPYVLKADVAAFFQTVDHSILAMILGGSLDQHSDVVQAVEHFLGAVMRGSNGLPQGPHASDILSSAYLSLIDRRVSADGWRFARYADDYLIAADSMADGRSKLETLERYLGEHQLHLSDPKSTIMRSETYAKARRRPPPALGELRRELRTRREEYLRNAEDSDDVAEMLTHFGADEQLLFDVLYHGNTTIEEAIEELGERLNPEDTAVYLTFLRRADNRLRRGSATADMSETFVLVRDCTAHLAAAQEPSALKPVERLLQWFPGLGPVAAIYFESIAPTHGSEVDESLFRLLNSNELPDWTSAWLCRSIQRRRGDVSDRLLGILSDEIATGSRPLTKVCATWALAERSALNAEHWRAVLESSGPALRAELLLEREARPDRYPARAALPRSEAGSLSPQQEIGE